MPTSDEPEALLDTSAAVVFLLRQHAGHEAMFAALRDLRIGLAGHAAFETYSTLTRLPEPLRLSPGVASQLIAREFPHGRHLSGDGATTLLDRLAGLRIAGGSVYDAIVGAAAAESGVQLITRDRRAVTTYRLLGVDHRLFD